MMFVGLALVFGKWAERIAAPAAESDPDGALVFPPNPAAVYAVTANARPPNTTRPATRVGAGWRTIRTETRPQTPVFPVPSRVLLGQNTARPKMVSSAGSRVSPASSTTPTPRGRRGPRPQATRPDRGRR